MLIGAPDEIVGSAREAGAAWFLRVNAGGEPITSQRWTQDSAGVPGTAETGDHFGAALEMESGQTNPVQRYRNVASPCTPEARRCGPPLVPAPTRGCTTSGPGHEDPPGLRCPMKPPQLGARPRVRLEDPEHAEIEELVQHRRLVAIDGIEVKGSALLKSLPVEGRTSENAPVASSHNRFCVP